MRYPPLKSVKSNTLAYWGQTDFGGLAEYRIINPIVPGEKKENQWFTNRGFTDDYSAAAIKLDKTISTKTATILEPLTSVLRSLLFNPPKPGDTVIILGAGACGLLALQLFRNIFASGEICAVDKCQERLNLALKLGANKVFNPLLDAELIEKKINDSKGSYAQYIFDTLPNIDDSAVKQKNTRTMGMNLLNPGGAYILYGATEKPQSIETWYILAKGLKIFSAPFDVRIFPMQKSSYVLKTAEKLLSCGIINVDCIISNEANFYDPHDIKLVFDRQGKGGHIKTLINFNTSLT